MFKICKQYIKVFDWAFVPLHDLKRKCPDNVLVGYNFTFNNSGVLNANNGTNNYDGTWSISDSSSNDDNSQDDLDFNINFNITNNFEELNDDWDIISYSSTKIELIDTSDDNSETDYLTFEKN